MNRNFMLGMKLLLPPFHPANCRSAWRMPRAPRMRITIVSSRLAVPSLHRYPNSARSSPKTSGNFPWSLRLSAWSFFKTCLAYSLPVFSLRCELNICWRRGVGPTEGWPRGSEVGHRGPLRTDTVSVRCGGGFEKVPCGILVMIFRLKCCMQKFRSNVTPQHWPADRKVTR